MKQMTQKNYIVVPRTRGLCETIINAHKTSTSFEPLTKKLSIYLSNLIKTYIEKNKLNYGDNLFALSTLSRFVSKMSKDVGMSVSINTLRHMEISKFFSNNPTLEEKQKLAKEFGHSLRVQQEYVGNVIS